jgi:hypothetical protein
MIARVFLLVLALVCGCGTTPIISSGCIQTGHFWTEAPPRAQPQPAAAAVAPAPSETPGVPLQPPPHREGAGETRDDPAASRVGERARGESPGVREAAPHDAAAPPARGPVHLFKAGQPVDDDNLAVAVADDVEATREARRARRAALAAIPLGVAGFAASVAGIAVTADGAHGGDNRELAVGIPVLAVGFAALVVSMIEITRSNHHGARAILLYNERHPGCR